MIALPMSRWKFNSSLLNVAHFRYPLVELTARNNDDNWAQGRATVTARYNYMVKLMVALHLGQVLVIVRLPVHVNQATNLSTGRP